MVLLTNEVKPLFTGMGNVLGIPDFYSLAVIYNKIEIASRNSNMPSGSKKWPSIRIAGLVGMATDPTAKENKSKMD